ncbi:MAG TPA: S8 family serine peptidase, partial [Candidatus Polarisedimenticolaceae bacterium]|nr:S8 family serine peptidase [Candidatus Polarisedimenticolaceae bacterium]
CDDFGHGTHTMGTIVGDDGATNQIGVAPSARWIGCRNMHRSVGTPQSYTECFQWFVAPTDLDGDDPDPALAPDVINNSWSCPSSEGCSQSTLRTIVENTRAAGIVVVASAGNAGADCGSVATAPAHYAAALTVGATGTTDLIAPFSSRGPVLVDGSHRLKPDLVAPGVTVRSSVPGDDYDVNSGTSMAAPHVVGVTALLLSARPDLAGRVDEIEAILRASTVPLTTTEGCGGDSGVDVPNNTYGAGRIDAVAAITGDADGDLVVNLDDCAPANGSWWSVPSPARNLTLEGGTLALISWQPPLEPGAATVQYEVLRSERADDFSNAVCVAGPQKTTAASDAAVPSTSFYYKVRVHNACGAAGPDAPSCAAQ